MKPATRGRTCHADGPTRHTRTGAAGAGCREDRNQRSGPMADRATGQTRPAAERGPQPTGQPARPDQPHPSGTRCDVVQRRHRMVLSGIAVGGAVGDTVDLRAGELVVALSLSPAAHRADAHRRLSRRPLGAGLRHQLLDAAARSAGGPRCPRNPSSLRVRAACGAWSAVVEGSAQLPAGAGRLAARPCAAGLAAAVGTQHDRRRCLSGRHVDAVPAGALQLQRVTDVADAAPSGRVWRRNGERLTAMPPPKATAARRSAFGGPADQRTSRPADQQTSRPADQRTSEPANQRTSEPANQRTSGDGTRQS